MAALKVVFLMMSVIVLGIATLARRIWSAPWHYQLQVRSCYSNKTLLCS